MVADRCKLELIDEKGGYQLYHEVRIEPDLNDSGSGYNRGTFSFLEKNDKVKVVKRDIFYGEPHEYDDSYREKCSYWRPDKPVPINDLNIPLVQKDIFHHLNQSIGESKFHPGNFRKTLEEIEGIRKKRGSLAYQINKERILIFSSGLLAHGSDCDYAISDGFAMGGYHNLLMDLPVFSIPEDILKERRNLIDHEWCVQRAIEYHAKNNLTGIIRNVRDAGNDAGNKGVRDVANFVKEKFFRDDKYYDEENISRGLVDISDAIGAEIKRHRSTLKILNYLESRVEG
jgi:hypothetical protein